MAIKRSNMVNGHDHVYDTDKEVSEPGGDGHVHPLIKNNLGGVTDLGMNEGLHIHVHKP